MFEGDDGKSTTRLNCRAFANCSDLMSGVSRRGEPRLHEVADDTEWTQSKTTKETKFMFAV